MEEKEARALLTEIEILMGTHAMEEIEKERKVAEDLAIEDLIEKSHDQDFGELRFLQGYIHGMRFLSRYIEEIQFFAGT